MDWIFVTAAVLGAWVLVSLTGYERQRRIDAIAPPAGAAAATAPPSAAPAETSPHRLAA